MAALPLPPQASGLGLCAATPPSDPEMCVTAPAKINLFLHVTGRRADGYHTLQSVFRCVDLADEIRLTRRDDGQIYRCEGPLQVPQEQDLVVKAARLLKAHTHTPWGVDLALHKRIPMGAGLGGGSSDAASVLLALNTLWGTFLSDDALATLGLTLGADIPFFIARKKDVWVEGVGEGLLPLRLPAQHYVLVWPGVEVPTASVFQAPELCRNTPPIDVAAWIDTAKPALSLPELTALMAQTRNDLEPVACHRYPPIKAALTWLHQFGPARMTGSGSTVFVPVDEAEHAQAIVQRCPHPQWKAFAVTAPGETGP
jgi:4-diphosphocytidyl-2-C-methyl-D-erythritol kinase